MVKCISFHLLNKGVKKVSFGKLKIGTKIEIRLSDVKESPQFVSQFEGIERDGTFCILAPIYKAIVQPIELGTKLNIYFVQKGGSFYKLKGKVTGRGKKSAISVLKVQALSEIEKIQRRKFFRFECINPIKYRIIQYSKIDCKREIDFKQTITRDLSGGGVCIKLTEKLNVGDVVECVLFLSDINKVCFWGKVIRFTEYTMKKGIYKYEAGISFKKIEDKSREKIISYIFEEQRRLVKKD